MNRSLFEQFRCRYSGLVALLTVAAFAAAALLAAPPAPGASPGERRAAGLEREIGRGAHVLTSAETGEVRFVGTNPGAPVERPPGLTANAGSERVSRAYLQLYGRYFGLGDQRRELELDDKATGPEGRAWVRMQQLHEGVPVLGGQLVVNLDRDRNLRSVSGELLPELSLEVEPRIGAVEAGRAATTAVAKAYGVATARLRGNSPELSIYDSRLLGGPGLDAPRLVWRVEVTAKGGPIREFVLVDAQLGSVALQFDQIAHGRDREVCDAGNADAEYPCTPALAERSEGEAPTGNPDVDDAYEFAGDTYDFFAGRFGRDSLDDNGMKLVSTTRYCPPGEPCPYENAFWDGAQMVYGEGFAAADDVVGHELSHGVTEFSSHLFYYYQSGAINESLSDVFGEFVDLTNGSGSDSEADRWLLGEDIPGIGAIRDMADPTSFGDPDRMTSPNYTADPGEGDAGGVHTNSSVNNKAAYLMTDGDIFNGQTVDGLGTDKVARIYYEVESAMLTSASDYADLASGLGQACANLVGTNGISAADCDEVADAVQATEMDQQPPVAPATEAPTCATGTAVSSFTDDLETPGAGNWTRTASTGSNEWYYPQNSNPYAFDATYATSGSRNFWGYDRPSTGDYSIEMSSDVTVPAAPAFLRFEHAYGFEDSVSPPRNWDGGVVEYSTDGGSTWNDAGGLITDNGYSGTITSSRGSANPLKGRGAFVGESNGYISSRLDLASLEGEDVRFRFRIGTDASVDDYGWFVDDVQIYGCAGGDTDPPDTTIDTGPTGTITTDQATFTFSGTPAGDTAKIQCKLDSGSFSDCTSPKTFTGLTDGPHTATFRAEDAAGNQDPTPASSTFTVDTTPPDTTIDTGPTGTITTDQATFTFSGTPAGDTAKIQCKLDSGSFSDCTSPKTFTGLTDGPHTATFRAEDAAGNQDQSPATRTFTVDTTPPDTTIDTGPTGTITTDQATFTFSGTPAGDTAKIQCKLDSGSFSDCTSPKTFTGLTDGPHTATFRAEDAAGNQDQSPATRTFTVDTTPPDTTIDTGPTGTITTDQATFTFSGTPAGDTAKIQCKLDSGSFSDCTSPKTFTGLTDGPHTATFRAEDAAGNQDPTPASSTFTVDTTPPSLQIDSGPSGTTSQQSPTFGFAAEPGSGLECSIDTGTPDFGPCSDPSSHTPAAPLADAAYTFRVRATDAASNQTTRTRSFAVDADPPQTTIDSGPSSPSNDPDPAFTFSADKPGSSFECRLDTATWSSCASPKVYTNLPEGPHSFEVRATDAAANIDPTPASHAFAVDTTPPDTAIDNGPGALTGDSTPTFSFSADETATFDCRLYRQGEAAPAFGACSGPGDTHTPNPALTEGDYTFEARATDVAGNVDATPASRDFTVDTTPPDTTIDTGPTGTITTDQATFTFSGTPAGDTAKIQCKLDSGSFSDCTSPKTFTGLTDGPHTATFRAEDAAGNQDQTPASSTFTVDTTPPDTTIDTGPTGTITTDQATFTFSGTPAGDTAKIQCKLDSGSFSDCTSPKTFTGLTDGPHTATFRAEDAAGNQDPSPATRSFTVDTTVPEPPGPSVACETAESDLSAANLQLAKAKKQQKKAKKQRKRARKQQKKAKKSGGAAKVKKAKKKLKRAKKKVKKAKKKVKKAKQAAKAAEAAVAGACA